MDHPVEGRMDDHWRMEIHLNLQSSTCIWAVDIVEATRQHSKLRTFTLEPEEMLAMNMDCEVKLSSLIANDITDPWVAITESYDYRTLDEEIRHTRPGQDVDGLRVIRLYLKPEPENFPYVEFHESFCEVSNAFGMDYHRFLFEYNDMKFATPSRLVTFLEHEHPPHEMVTHSITRCHQENIGWLKHAKPQNRSELIIKQDASPKSSMTREQKIKLLKATLHSLTVEDELVRELKLSRKEMAEVLNVKVNTIRSWEKGEAPCEHAWPKPGKNSRKHTVYPVVNYLPAMQQLQYNR